MDSSKNPKHLQKEKIWRERAAKLFCIVAAALAVWFVLKYAMAAVVVFLAAWSIAAVIHPLAVRTARLLRISCKLCATFYVLLLLCLMGGLVFFCVRRLTEELKELLLWMEENQAWIAERLGAFFDASESLFSRLPLLGGAESSEGPSIFGASLETVASGLVKETVSALGARLTDWAASLLGVAPKLFILLIVTVTACFYWSMDYERIRDFLFSLLPCGLTERAERLRQRAGRAIRSYIRAYLLILLLTFCEVFTGLLILGQPYAFLIALGVAIVDLLPIFGAGTVLIPWAMIQLLLKRYSMGVGLLILYGVITIVRQVAEPRIVGGSLGIHPLASLLFMLIGWQLFGLTGMLLGPAAALLVKELLGERGRACQQETGSPAKKSLR